MSADVSARIAKVVETHTAESLRCCLPCGYQASSRADHANHVAEQIVAQLQLTPEYAYEWDDTVGVRRRTTNVTLRVALRGVDDKGARANAAIVTRLVSPWVVVEGEKP